jgi:hypothetical protein
MTAGSTYTPIATYTGNGTLDVVTFSSIPSTYTDIVVAMTFNTSSGDYITVKVNNDSSGSYSFVQTYGVGSGAGGTARSDNQAGVTWESDPVSPDVANTIMNFQNYSNTSTYKTFLIRSNLASSVTRGIVAAWRSSSAINRIDFSNGGSSQKFSAGTVITLYGIAAA